MIVSRASRCRLPHVPVGLWMTFAFRIAFPFTDNALCLGVLQMCRCSTRSRSDCSPSPSWDKLPCASAQWLRCLAPLFSEVLALGLQRSFSLDKMCFVFCVVFMCLTWLSKVSGQQFQCDFKIARIGTHARPTRGGTGESIMNTTTGGPLRQ